MNHAATITPTDKGASTRLAPFRSDPWGGGVRLTSLSDLGSRHFAGAHQRLIQSLNFIERKILRTSGA